MLGPGPGGGCICLQINYLIGQNGVVVQLGICVDGNFKVGARVAASQLAVDAAKKSRVENGLMWLEQIPEATGYCSTGRGVFMHNYAFLFAVSRACPQKSMALSALPVQSVVDHLLRRLRETDVRTDKGEIVCIEDTAKIVSYKVKIIVPQDSIG